MDRPDLEFVAIDETAGDADSRINWLAAARLFLFGSRDVWFAVALPVFLAAELGWSFSATSGFLALWVVGYGAVQALAPAFLGRADRSEGRFLFAWTAALGLPLTTLLAFLHGNAPVAGGLVGLLAVFGALFAANSALHSFLIVHYAERDHVALRVGFYYVANAAGRLVGTVLSGAVFQLAGQRRPGLASCIATSLGFTLVAALLSLPLARAGVVRTVDPARPAP